MKDIPQMSKSNHFPIVIADDDPDDRLLIQTALEENRLPNPLIFVENGEELMDYLYQKGNYADQDRFARPGFILLDLNMPRKDGREALREIKCNPQLRQIPVLVLTTSNLEVDIQQSYALGANSYMRKPTTYEGLSQILAVIETFWLDIAQLPL